VKDAESILGRFTGHLAEIKQAVGEQQWADFAVQMGEREKVFAELEAKIASTQDEAELDNLEETLTDAANQMLAILVTNEAAEEILVESASSEAGVRSLLRASRHYTKEEDRTEQAVDLQTIANSFYLLAKYADKFADGISFEQITKDANADRVKRQSKSGASTEELNDNEE